MEQVDHYGGNRHGVRIFVPGHRPPDPSVAKCPLVSYVNDGIVSAMAQAKAAAGDRSALVRVELEVIRGIDTPDATHIRYRVRR